MNNRLRDPKELGTEHGKAWKAQATDLSALYVRAACDIAEARGDSLFVIPREQGEYRRAFIAAAEKNDPLQKLLDAAQDRQKKGHHDTCDLAKCGDTYPCTCGYDALGEALELFQ